jgi:hypothetical protein
MSAQEFGPFVPDPVALRFDKPGLSVIGKAQPLPSLNRLDDDLIHAANRLRLSLSMNMMLSTYERRIEREKRLLSPLSRGLHADMHEQMKPNPEFERMRRSVTALRLTPCCASHRERAAQRER